MQKKLNISIQGYPGSFHDEASKKFFILEDLNIVPADSFDILATHLRTGACDYGVMAIENSIAGTILQNYRILRENDFWILGEVYLRIKHNLLVNKGVKKEDIKTIYSHPMALSQCLDFFKSEFPNAKLTESKDTALSAIELAKTPNSTEACVASLQAAKLTDLEVLAEGIETSKNNYTRFFIISNERHIVNKLSNKASVYIRIPDEKGQLLKVLACIDRHGLNMSKLQSFPVLGKFREYFFHLDIEFDAIEKYTAIREELNSLTNEFTELGVYQRADISDVILINEEMQTV